MKNLILITSLAISLNLWAEGGADQNSCQCPNISAAMQAVEMTTPTLAPNTCNSLKSALVRVANREGTAINILGLLESASAENCDTCCPSEEVLTERDNQRERENEAAGAVGQIQVSKPGSKEGSKLSYSCFPQQSLISADGAKARCVSLLDGFNSSNHPDDISKTNVQSPPATPGTTPQGFYKPVVNRVNFENPDSFMMYFNNSEMHEGIDKYDGEIINESKVCRLYASACNPPADPVSTQNYNAYKDCIHRSIDENHRRVIVGIEKSMAIVEAAKESTRFKGDHDFGGEPFACTGNKEGLAFDHPKCKTFYSWYVALEATTTGFEVGNEAAVITTNMRNQTRLQQQMAEGNGQDAGFDVARRASIAAKEAEDRKMAFFSAKGAAILAQLKGWPNRENICSGSCCELFTAQGADRIDKDFFPNQGAKQHVYAQAIKAMGQVAVAKLTSDLHKENARKVNDIKEQMQFADESDEGVMKFCVQFPQDVRCLSPGERRSLGASGTQFGGFEGSNFGLATLEGEQANDLNVGEDFSGNLGAAAGGGNIASIGDANKEAAAAKDIFRAPPAARAGAGGGAGGGGAGGGGGGGSAQAGQLSRDEGLNQEKKENPIEITSKKAAYEGSKGGYNGGGYRPGNKKPADTVSANPFASMFGKDKGRDPANIAEIDKPASDLFAKISRRYGEVQKRKGLLDVAGEDQSGIR